MRASYWSCTKFADWLRGTAKPTAETSQGWNHWRKRAQTAHKIRYWLAEEALDSIQSLVMWPSDKIYDLKYYINNRWVTRTHALTASPEHLKRGQWCDVGQRFLPCLFDELVDFVEIEQAWHHVAWDQEARKKYKTPWWGVGWFRWRTWRSPEAGLAYLDWAANLTCQEDHGYDPSHKDYNKPTGQAVAAREIKELYHWWKVIRPLRPDPMDASGWSDICRRRSERHPDDEFLFDVEETPEEKAETRKSLDACHYIEEQYEKEDEAMMIRLIKIRNHLWT